MITLPDYKKSFEYENNFYLSSDITRMSKVLAHYELFKMVSDIPGEIVECGVFKGGSLIRFATFRELFSNPYSKKIIGFDTFKKFPQTNFIADQKLREHGIKVAGENVISRKQLMSVLKHKGIDKNIKLVEGNITKTVPAYVKSHGELKISLLNLDADLYEPSVTVLEYLYPRIAKGGVLLLDEYSTWSGATKAIDEYFKDKKVKIRKFPFCMTPCYIVKEEE